METKFYSDTFVLDLSKQKMNLQENNSRFNDKSFTKFTFPFEVNVEDQFVHYIGDYASKENTGLPNILNGWFHHENKISEAKLTIITIQGNKLIGQIDYGLEDIPNYDKKLSELPLAKFAVDDIHIYAKEICTKKYPEVNFNYPRLYTTKYSPEDELWDAFDGYYNDLKPDGSEMRRNYLDEELNIFNVNIIHPLPYILYLLKTGFGDKGLELKGDILTDPDLVQRCVFSGTEYFNRFSQRRDTLTVDENEYDQFSNFSGMFYIKELKVQKKGEYKLRGYFNSRKVKGSNTGYIMMGSNKLWSFNSGSYDETNYYFDFSVNVPEDNTSLIFFLWRVSDRNGFATVISADLIGTALDDGGNEETGVVTNPNEVDLARAVPDMTFGDFVNRIKNWFNYEIDIRGNEIFMTKLNKDPDNIKSFQQYEVSEPKRTLMSQRSYQIKFTELDESPEKLNLPINLNSMYYDSSGIKLNGEPKSDTSIIEIDGYCMPVLLPKPGGYTTAIVRKDSTTTLALVYYDGLIGNQNNAKNPSGCEFPELWDKNWYKFLRQRIYGSKYEDSFLAYIEDISQYTIKDYIYWHNNIHQISSWGKEMVSENVYKISITTETIV
ncbi:hypothetical protein ACFO4P_17180 [Epilithonimonas pallida]|uniref:Uncharacterized protein n=1 Tax=Epilithonimonas pallida TaxID=373671 RepID=A0ABY1R5L9_9FLAO|nr:hypothetical protein [Epilithonimonas pallida]SMP94736.1 hypothetical protein SAMN05421679_106122 [Epilithonimonas pallida]